MGIVATLFLSFSLGWADSDFTKPDLQPQRPRSDVVSPALSLLLPGAGQWFEGQYKYAAVYSVVGFSGASLAASATTSQDDYDQFIMEDTDYRRALIGDALYKTAGGISAYHDFRTAVASRRGLGQYGFLPSTEIETPLDLALAPFNFKYILRPTTYVPLLVLVAGLSLAHEKDSWQWEHYTLEDAGITAAVSYGAGVGEEAAFRGFFHPVLHEYMGERFWLSNSTQALVFGAAHIGPRNRFPLIQTLLGGYFGWMTRRNQWQIGEGIFLHAWWDVFAIGAEFATSGKVNQFRLPTLNIPF